jgi:putative transferase (TIGR04331 family)
MQDTNAHPPLLATTALEETWGTNEPLVFLGEWCRLYDRRDVWGKRQHQVIPNHWNDRKKLRRDYDYLKGLHDTLLVDLVQAMNARNGIDRPLRYWQMILDPWLLTYIGVIWDGWENIRAAFEKHERLETIALPSNRQSAPFFDWTDFIDRVLDDPWNHQLYLEIIELNFRDRCDVRRLPPQLATTVDSNTDFSNKPKTNTLKRKLAKLLDSGLGILPVKNRAVFYDAYFSPAALMQLNLNIGQVPRLYLQEFDWPIAFTQEMGVHHGKSRTSGLALKREPSDPFEDFLCKRLVKDIPLAYTDHFALLRDRAGEISLRPKVIFTANAHWYNELFKLWSAEQVMKGAKFVTVEHGGSIVTAFSAMSFEEDIADIKTTWAAPFHPKHKRLPASKLAARKITSTGKYLAVVGCELPRYNLRADACPKSGQALEDYSMVLEMHALLAEKPKAHFLIKPYPNRGWNTQQRYIDALGPDKVSDERKYYKFLSCARMVVCTYPQTTFSEAMASGLPSILFYPAHLWETIPEMDALLETLRRAKIVFHDAKAAATHINAVWDAPDRWWNSPETLAARAEFRRQAALIGDNWLSIWTTFIEETIAPA